MAEGNQVQTKLDEQARAKGELSYSYFAASSTKNAAPPPPKQITDAEAEKLKRSASVGASAWYVDSPFFFPLPLLFLNQHKCYVQECCPYL